MKTPEEKLISRNKYCFGLGTVGRDMFYAFEANACNFISVHFENSRFDMAYLP